MSNDWRKWYVFSVGGACGVGFGWLLGSVLMERFGIQFFWWTMLIASVVGVFIYCAVSLASGSLAEKRRLDIRQARYPGDPLCVAQRLKDKELAEKES